MAIHTGMCYITEFWNIWMLTQNLMRQVASFWWGKIDGMDKKIQRNQVRMKSDWKEKITIKIKCWRVRRKKETDTKK